MNAQINLADYTGDWDATNHVTVWHTNVFTIFTSNDGTFRISPRQKWSLLIIPEDVFARHFELSVQHSNYHTLMLPFIHSAMDSGKFAGTNFGILKLTPE